MNFSLEWSFREKKVWVIYAALMFIKKALWRECLLKIQRTAENGRTAEPENRKPESKDPQIKRPRKVMASQCAIEPKNQWASEPGNHAASEAPVNFFSEINFFEITEVYFNNLSVIIFMKF